MKSNYKLIGSFSSDGIESKIYYDKKRNCYYKYDESIEKIDDTDINLKSIKVMHEIDHQIKKKKNIKKCIKGFVLATLIGVSIIGVKEIYERNEDKIEFILDDENPTNTFEYFKKCLENNITINKVQQENILKYLSKISEYDLDTLSYIRIGENLKSIDFTKYNLETEELTDVLQNILECNDNGFLVRQLYSEINGINLNEDDYAISLIFIKDNNIITDLLNGKSLDKLLKKYDIELDKIKERKYLEKKILNYYKEDQNINGIDSIIVFSDYLGGVFKIENNIFSKYIKINYNGEYNVYFDECGIDCSKEYYIQKINDLIIQNKGTLNYNNMDDRVLLYLYANACLEKNEYTDICKFLYPKDNFAKAFSQSDLFKYFYNGKLCGENLKFLYELVFNVETLPLLQEINLCLKQDALLGNISYNDYSYFKFMVELFLSNNPLEYEKWTKANIEQCSIDGYKLKLISIDTF